MDQHKVCCSAEVNLSHLSIPKVPTLLYLRLHLTPILERTLHPFPTEDSPYCRCGLILLPAALWTAVRAGGHSMMTQQDHIICLTEINQITSYQYQEILTIKGMNSLWWKAAQAQSDSHLVAFNLLLAMWTRLCIGTKCPIAVDSKPILTEHLPLCTLENAVLCLLQVPKTHVQTSMPPGGP